MKLGFVQGVFQANVGVWEEYRTSREKTQVEVLTPVIHSLIHSEAFSLLQSHFLLHYENEDM